MAVGEVAVKELTCFWQQCNWGGVPLFLTTFHLPHLWGEPGIHLLLGEQRNFGKSLAQAMFWTRDPQPHWQALLPLGHSVWSWTDHEHGKIIFLVVHRIRLSEWGAVSECRSGEKLILQQNFDALRRNTSLYCTNYMRWSQLLGL